jgi:hypothetical protein
LASDLHHFRTYSTFYWERACALGSLALAPGEVKKSVANDVRILLREMVRCVDTQAIARVRAVLQFEFPDQSLAFHVALDRGTCTLGEGGVEKPDLLVRCDSGTWAAIFTREINVREALRDGRIVLAGDKSLFMRLDRFFPPPSE